MSNVTDKHKEAAKELAKLASIWCGKQDNAVALPVVIEEVWPDVLGRHFPDHDPLIEQLCEALRADEEGWTDQHQMKQTALAAARAFGFGKGA